MRVLSLFFTLLFFVVAQSSYAQTTKPRASEQAPKPAVRMDSKPTGKGLSDAAILLKADQIRYLTRYQDYSNLVNALADSKLEVSDRLATFNRLTEMYFADKPETVKLPTSLLTADGRPLSKAEMADFMTRLTKKAAPDTASKSHDSSAYACLLDYYLNVWPGSELAQVFPDYVIVAYPTAASSCNMTHLWIYAPTSSFPSN